MKKLTVDQNEESFTTLQQGLVCVQSAVLNIRIKIITNMTVICVLLCTFVNLVTERNVRIGA